MERRRQRGWISSHSRWEGVPPGTHTPHHGQEPHSCPLKVAVPACPLQRPAGVSGAPCVERGRGAARQGSSPEKRSQSSPEARDALPAPAPAFAPSGTCTSRAELKSGYSTTPLSSSPWPGGAADRVCGADPSATSTSPPRAGVVLRTAPPSASLEPRGQSEAHGQRCSTGQAGCPWHCAGSPEGHRCHPTPQPGLHGGLPSPGLTPLSAQVLHGACFSGRV